MIRQGIIVVQVTADRGVYYHQSSIMGKISPEVFIDTASSIILFRRLTGSDDSYMFLSNQNEFSFVRMEL